MNIRTPPPDLFNISPPSSSSFGDNSFFLGVEAGNLIVGSSSAKISSSRRCSLINCGPASWSPNINDSYNTHQIGGMANKAVHNASHQLYVFSNLLCTYGVQAYSSSDIRLKDDVLALSGSLSQVLKMTPVQFRWKEGCRLLLKGKDLGFIAQQVEPISPYLVKTRESGYKAVDYKKISVLIVSAIKERNSHLQKIKLKIKLLKNG
jgi:hypothetical protein